MIYKGGCWRYQGRTYSTLKAALLAAWPKIRVAFDDWAFDLEDMARRLSCDPDTPPLAVICDGRGRAVYAASGYRVGAAELLMKIAAHVCEKGEA